MQAQLGTMGKMFAFALLFLSVLAGGPVPEDSLQMLVVITADAEATRGLLFRFERARSGEAWSAVGEPWDVTVGERGLAAGLGLHRGILPRVPVKAEGDGRSPAGVFELPQAFGFVPKPAAVRMPYLMLTDRIECVDDPESRDYGRILRRGVAAAWTSSERMREIDDYEWGVVVAHNQGRKPSAGSCIFLHAWSGDAKPTVGCTAMELSHIEALVAWLDEDREPVLVQLPRDLYRDLAVAWELPEGPLDALKE